MIYPIIFLALILRLVNLNQSFWLDEAAQVIESARPLKDQFSLPADFHPPLFHILLHFWMIFGRSEIWIRMLPVLFGIGSVYLIYHVSEAIGKSKAGIWAAFFLSVSPYHIWYSQEARPYMLFVFLSLLATDALIRNKWIFYTLISFFTLYSFYFSPFLFLSHLAYILLFQRKQGKKFTLSILAALILFIPWLPSFWTQLNIGTNGFFKGWTDIVSMIPEKAIPSLFAKFIFGKGTITNKIEYTLAIIPELLVFILCQFNIAGKKEGKLISILFWIPLVAATATAIIIPVLAPQRLLFLLPVFCLILGLGASAFPKKIQAASIIIILVTSLLGVYQYYTDPYVQREEWRQAVRFVENESNQNSIALFVFPDPFAPYIWYERGVLPAKGIAPSFLVNQSDLEKLSTYVITKERVFFFQYLTGITDPEGKTLRYLESSGFKLTRVKDFPGVGFIYILDKIPYGTVSYAVSYD